MRQLKINPSLNNARKVRLNRASVAVELQSLIRQWVFTRKLVAGDRINEKSLAEKLGISRGPIREAIQALRQEGLVEIIPNRGAFLKKLSLKQIIDLYDVMAGLGYTAGRLLPSRISEDHLIRLFNLHEKMKDSISRDDPLGFFKHNQVFHDTLFKAARNEALLETMRNMEKRMMLYLHREATTSWMLEDSNKQHHEILSNIASGNSEGAAMSIFQHVLFGKQRTIDQWE
jgi:DNA-binding GntR family transcriptional regulator